MNTTPSEELSAVVIDPTFDFRADTPPRKDPDSHSKTLRRYHRHVWSKPLPNGQTFALSDKVRGHYLHHQSALGEFSLSSDSVMQTFTRWGFAARHPELCGEAESAAFFTAFDDFTARAVPQDLDTYKEYRRQSMAFIEARNARMPREIKVLG